MRETVSRFVKLTRLSRTDRWVSFSIMIQAGGRFGVDGPAAVALLAPPLLAGLVLGANQTRAGVFMPWLGSIGYWIVISFATWWLLALATFIVNAVLRPWQPPRWSIWAAGAVAGSFAARPAIYAITDLFRPMMQAPVLRSMRPLRLDFDFLGYYVVNWSLVIALWVATCGLAAWWRQHWAVPRPEPRIDRPDQAAPQGILLRIPPGIGRDILALRAEDHYVRVHTRDGQALVLGSLSDAIGDLERSGYAGQRTHRSWWVVRGAVSSRIKRGRHTILVLANGAEVPVSITYREMTASSDLVAT